MPRSLVKLFDDWERCFDEASGHHYYYSESRNESTWDQPKDSRVPGGKTPTPRKWTPSKGARPTPRHARRAGSS